MKNPTVEEIVTHHLQVCGYDGLYTEDCGCLLGDLFPCGWDCFDCRAGYKGPPRDDELGDDLGWSVGPDKPKENEGGE